MATVSLNAKQGLETILSECLHDSLRTANNPEWNVRSGFADADMKEQQVYMLTVSSYTFRIIVLLQFTDNAATRAYVAHALKIERDKLDESRYYDYLGEMGNTFCGAFKREVGKYYPHTGMSTPNKLAGQSLRYLTQIATDFHTHVKASEEIDKARFIGSLYISAFGDVDFKVEKGKKVEEPVETGALELF